jgi:hypothetical protein
MSCIERKRILLAEFDDNFRVAPGSCSITANHLEVGLEDVSVDQGRDMTGFGRVGDGFFDERPRRPLDELTLPEAREHQEAAAKPTLRCPCFAFSLAQKCSGDLPRQPQLAAHDVADPQTVINGESLGRVIDRRRKFPGADEGGLRFLGPETPRKH